MSSHHTTNAACNVVCPKELYTKVWCTPYGVLCYSSTFYTIGFRGMVKTIGFRDDYRITGQITMHTVASDTVCIDEPYQCLEFGIVSRLYTHSSTGCMCLMYDSPKTTSKLNLRTLCYTL